MAMQISLSKVQGQLYQHIQSARAALMHLLQHIEASIDFPDEVEGITEPEFYEAIAPAQKLLDDAHNLKDFGRRVKSGTRAIILGYPNVGKSSLFNRLLGESRAIVSQTAGTTRDYIETDIELGGLLFHLFDTAGFRSETSDDIEVAGIQKISQLKDESDVLIWVLDGTRELCTDEQRFLGELPDYDGEVLILINKRDHEDFDLTHIPQDPLSAWPQLIISTQNTEDISALKSEILKLVPAPSSEQHWAVVCNTRQLACLDMAQAHMTDLIEHYKAQHPHDLLAVDIKACIAKLGEITGDDLTEEVLDGVFSRFCVGK